MCLCVYVFQKNHTKNCYNIFCIFNKKLIINA